MSIVFVVRPPLWAFEWRAIKEIDRGIPVSVTLIVDRCDRGLRIEWFKILCSFENIMGL